MKQEDKARQSPSSLSSDRDCAGASTFIRSLRPAGKAEAAVKGRSIIVSLRVRRCSHAFVACRLMGG